MEKVEGMRKAHGSHIEMFYSEHHEIYSTFSKGKEEKVVKGIGHVRSGWCRAEEEFLKHGLCWVNLFRE